MILSFAGRDALLKNVVDDVTDKSYGCNWNLAIPPCFGATEALDDVTSELRNRPGVVVADVTSDICQDSDTFLHRLYEQWSEQVSLPPLRPLRADAAFDYLMGSLPDDRVFVQVVRQFHKIMDCVGVEFLGQMRDAEQRGKIRTVSTMPYAIPDMKKRWDRHHPCTVSGYGDHHTETYVTPPAAEHVQDFLIHENVNKGIAKYVCAQSGGYPEVVLAILRYIKRHGVKSLTRSVMEEFQQIATGCLRRFVELIDDRNQNVYRNAVVDLFHGVEQDDAIDCCRLHPWAEIVLTEASELRSTYLGVASIQEMVRQLASNPTATSLAQDQFRRSVALYRARKFSDALTILDALPISRSDLALTKTNVVVMKSLYLDSGPGEDTDWEGVVTGAGLAKQAMTQFNDPNGIMPILAERLQKLESIGAKITALQRAGEKRVVDALAGLRNADSRCEESAAFLLVTKFEACTAISGHAAACQASIALPEQLLRVWAYWAIEVNYYVLPLDVDKIWNVAETYWPTQHGALRRDFKSLVGFGFFALAAAMEKGLSKELLPVSNFAELQSVFTSYEQLRNPQAHSYCFTTRKERERFFSLADRWLNCALSVCPSAVSRKGLRDLVEPLPLIRTDSNRNLVVID